jgi:hypothetical protein
VHLATAAATTAAEGQQLAVAEQELLLPALLVAAAQRYADADGSQQYENATHHDEGQRQ